MSTIPESPQEDLTLCSSRGPIPNGFDSAIELFPAASYQYVVCRVGFKLDLEQQAYVYRDREQALRIVQRNQQPTQQMLQSLPPHREYIERWLASTTSN